MAAAITSIAPGCNSPGILGYADFLRAAVPPGTQVAEDVEAIQHLGTRAATLTRQLLAFSRQQALEPVWVDVNALITNLARMLRRLIGEEIDLHLELAPVPLDTRLDVSQIEQALINLVLNARDAMPGGGVLTISTREVLVTAESIEFPAGLLPGAYIELIVRDTGMGMDTAIQAHIFEPF